MIHPTAILDGEITFTHGEDSVDIGPYAVLRGPISLGRNCKVEPHACIEGRVTIGDECVIGHHTVIGGAPQDLSFDPKTDSGVIIGNHNVIRELVTIHRSTCEGGSTVLGDHNFLMAASHVAHDAIIGNHNVLANAVLLAGHIEIGNHVFLGGGSVFHQFIKIGDRALAQGNAAISQDIPPFTIVHGYNMVAGMNVIGLRRGGINAADRASLKTAFNRVIREGASPESIESAQAGCESDIVKNFYNAFISPSRKGVCRRM